MHSKTKVSVVIHLHHFSALYRVSVHGTQIAVALRGGEILLADRMLDCHEELSAVKLDSSRWRQKITSKHLCPPTRLHGDKQQETLNVTSVF